MNPFKQSRNSRLAKIFLFTSLIICNTISFVEHCYLKWFIEALAASCFVVVLWILIQIYA